MTDRCTKHGCASCAQVDEADRVKPPALAYLPVRNMLGGDPTVVIPACWDDDTPLRYITPTTD